MSEPDSLYLRVRLSKTAYEQYLASPAANAGAFSDWMEWLSRAEMYGPPFTPEKIDQIGRRAGTRSVAQEIDAWTANTWAMAKSIYDEATETWRFGVLQFSENYQEYIALLPPFRAVCRFKDRPGADFMLLYSHFWDPGCYTALFEFSEGASVIAGSPGTGAPFPAQYAEEADVFLSSLIPSEDED